MKKLRIIDLHLILLVCSGISSIILRTYALLTSFNRITMHFNDKIAITIGGGIVMLATLGFISYLIFGEKEADLIATNDNAASFIPAGIVSITLLFIGVENIRLGIGASQNVLCALWILSGILAFLSIGSFFVSIFIQKNENTFKAAFSLSIVFFLVIYAMTLFFNRETHPTNSPNKIVDQMAYVFAAIFFLYESRIPLGRAKWRPYVAFGLIAALLTAYSAVPSLIVYAADGYLVSSSIVETLLSLALSFFMFSRVLQTGRLTANVECSEAKSVALLSEMREKELEDLRNAPRAQDNNNEDIEDAEDVSNYTFDIPYVEPTDEEPGSNSQPE